MRYGDERVGSTGGQFCGVDAADRVTLPVSFADVREDAGVPQMGFRYPSRNSAPYGSGLPAAKYRPPLCDIAGLSSLTRGASGAAAAGAEE